MSDFNVLAVSYTDPNADSLFAQSLYDTGFAILKDHPITQDEITHMYDVWIDYFRRADRFDDAVQPGEAHGYYAFKSENAKGRDQKDLKEFFHVYQSKPIPAAVEAQTREFHSKMLTIGSELLSWLDKQTPPAIEQQFSESLTQMIKGSDLNLLRILHYPPLDESVLRGEERAAAHEDINLLTLLVTGSEPGLQVKDNTGQWHDLPCNPGYITVNSGDMLAKASRNYYPSTPHRVINPTNRENYSRYSMPLFMHPRPEVRLDESQTAGEYLNERLREIGLE
ncbi:MAG: isopenicillin N synthase-like dioxygenase [Parasphingorhabdus sp.]|jgi:isopenicillin N synthase-like dioxygenase